MSPHQKNKTIKKHTLAGYTHAQKVATKDKVQKPRCLHIPEAASLPIYQRWAILIGQSTDTFW